MNILVTGGAGYIGSHTVLALLERGHHVVVLDNFSNSSPKVMPRLEALAGKPIPLCQVDLRDGDTVFDVLVSHKIDAVIHFAALKAVGESCEQPLQYFDNNVSGTISLLLAMQKANVLRFVFSSSAMVYGDTEHETLSENTPRSANNPYGRTKLMIEEIIQDHCAADTNFKAAILRYFNPVGAHPSGMIGEDPRGTPNNLMPYLCQVASGRREKLSVFGNDYPTPDGTGLRDYLHVMDLADAHLRAGRPADAQAVLSRAFEGQALAHHRAFAADLHRDRDGSPRAVCTRGQEAARARGLRRVQPRLEHPLPAQHPRARHSVCL